jgi:hypothetical protein
MWDSNLPKSSGNVSGSFRYMFEHHFLASSVQNGSVNQEYLSALEQIDNIFPGAD